MPEVSGKPDKPAKQPETATGKKGSGGSWVASLKEYMGSDSRADLNWKILFSDVFKHHTTEEAEEIFICGTSGTTPDTAHISNDLPRPWLYSRVFVLFFVAFVILWICVSAFENLNAFPGMIVVGSFTVPLAMMVLFMEANVWRNVSMYHVIQTFLVGGCASLLATLVLYSFISVDTLDFSGALLVSMAEEIGKMVIVYAFLRRLGKLSILSGMLIGASVGAGFAAFESAGYALQPFIQIMQYAGYAAAYGQEVDIESTMNSINAVIVVRGLLSPGGHVAWAAVSGAGLVIAAKVKGALDTGCMTNGRFLKLFLIPVVLHWLWDSPASVWFNELIPYSGYILLIVLVWIVVLILVNMGLAEVEREIK